jgi:hypothetical protein
MACDSFSNRYGYGRLHWAISTALTMARAFNVNLSSINRRINLLKGICPEAITPLQDKQFTPDVTRILRNMKAARQVEENRAHRANREAPER